MVAASPLTIQTGVNALAMAQEIFGQGVVVNSATYSGDNNSSGIYTGADTTMPGVAPSASGVILSSGFVNTVTNSSGTSNQSGGTSNDTNGIDNDAQLNAAAGTGTRDASILDVDFVPTGDILTLRFVFGSEEFPEYSNSTYNDMVGVWINGQQSTVTTSAGNSNVTSLSNATNLYVDNTASQYNTEMDGFTLTLSMDIPVVAGQMNSIRIAIADVSDSSYNSYLMIAGDSAQTVAVALDDTLTSAINHTKILDVLDNDTGIGTLTVTHINGVAVTAGDSVTLTTGQVITLNADGTLSVTTDSDAETVIFSYDIEDANGNVDSGMVTLNAVPCFARDTHILTVTGPCQIQDLVVGDVVETLDSGPQTLRWIGRRTVAAIGEFAPIHIAANTLGVHDDLWLSPQHRVLICDSAAELLFGEREVLIAAKDLINDRTIRRVEGGEVEYFHLLFDKHEVIFSEGLATESFLPGPQMQDSFEQHVVGEILSLFPELNDLEDMGAMPSVRASLKSFEAQVLLGPVGAAL
ncbi:MAG: Hint domain-containing protein [Halocynthiibacter sp.]